MLRPPRIGFVVLALLSALAIPSIVFTIVGIGSGMGVGGALAALAEQAAGRRLNVVMAGVLGVFPVLLLLGLLLLARWKIESETWLPGAGWGGLVAILLTLLWANFLFWPTFLPDRVAPSWPGGLELVIAPIFFAPVAMVVGLIVGGIAGRRSRPAADPEPPPSATSTGS